MSEPNSAVLHSTAVGQRTRVTIGSSSYQYTFSFSKVFFPSELLQLMPVSALPLYFDMNTVSLQHLRPYCESMLQLSLLEEYGRPSFCVVVKISFYIFFLLCQGLS